ERNLRRMAAHARASGKNLRPHAKTHRCPEIARRQVSNGALGVACATRGEDEVMARGGNRWRHITTEVVPAAAIPVAMRRGQADLPVEIVAGGSTGTWAIDVELPGLTELQAGSYCVMDIDYRRIGARAGAVNGDFEMALTVITTVVSVPTADRAMVDGGLKA